MAKREPVRLREPKKDCINYISSGTSKSGGCRGCNELYCSTELKPCPFYKSKYEYDASGRPLKGVKNG